MNSSGIKRGLAATAVAALAVTGLPFLASSSSAAQSASDTLAQGTTGPIRNGNTAGGVVTIKSNSAALVTADLSVTPADFSGAPVAITGAKELTSPAFDVDVISLSAVLDGNTDADNNPATGSLKFADGFYHYDLTTAVTLGTATKATFGLVEDMAPVGSANASDPKTVVEVTPTGAPATVDVAAATAVTTEGNPVTFNVEVKDTAGNLTQLVGGESFNVTSSAGSVVSNPNLDNTELSTGKASFTGTPAVASPDTMTVTVTGAVPPAATITDSASVSVFDNATITTDEFAFNTGADTWVDGTTAFGSPVTVRVDQDKVTFSFQSLDSNDPDAIPDDAGKVVGILLNSATIKFDGKTSAAPGHAVPVLLDSTGKGSVTVALSNVTATSTFTFEAPGSGIVSSTVTMSRAVATTVASDAAVYVSKIGSPTSVTVTVKDQFGNPIGAPAQVSITRGARNGGTTTSRVTVDATGKATISLPDAGPAAGSETFTINLYDDQFDATATNVAGGRIDYSVDGLGNDYTVTGATSDPAATVVTPVYDATATPATDAVTVGITGGTANAPAKVSVDGGALILSGADTTLNKAVASKTITLSGAGAGTVNVIGTKAGVVTVTIESGGRTKTVKLTIKQPAVGAALTATARNVELVGPETANAGGVATFTAKVTDAFGNPVEGVAASNLSFQISGPANLQSNDAATNGAGELKYNVILTDNANSTVTGTVSGVPSANTQFGKAANSNIAANDAPGLSVSVNTDSVTVSDVVNIAELEAAVEEAQDKVDTATDNLDAAKGDLAVAKAQLSVAQKAVKNAKKDLRQAKNKHKGVKAARKALREARGDARVARAMVSAEQGKVNTATTRLAAAQAELDAAEAALEEAQS